MAELNYSGAEPTEIFAFTIKDGSITEKQEAERAI